MQWRVPFAPGILEARGIFEGKEMKTKIETSGEAAGIRLHSDRTLLHADPMDLAYVTVEIVDNQGRLVPDAVNQVEFSLQGEGEILAVDNGLQTSMELFKASRRSAHKGRCLAIIKSSGQEGQIQIRAESEGLEPAMLEIHAEAFNIR